MRWVLVLAACAVLAGAAAGATGPAAGSAAFLTTRQAENGGFAEQGQTTGCRADGVGGSRPRRGERLPSRPGRGRREFLRSRPIEKATDGDVALRVVALDALGEPVDDEPRRAAAASIVRARS